MRTITEPIESTPPTEGEPAANWTPEQQIAHMLELCEAQMESALSESDLAVDTLIKAFTGVAEKTRTLAAIAEQLPTEAGSEMNAQIAQIREQMGSAVVAFQFYDKLTQRLGHVRYSLSTLAMFVCNRAQTSQREQWQRLFTTLRRLYRTEEEREIFQLMVEGVSANDARAQAEQHSAERGPVASGDIELF